MQSINRTRPDSSIALQAELSSLIAERQQQISTGRRIDKPSDDAVAWSQISDVARVQANSQAWLRNIDRGLTIAAQAESALDEISNHLSRANELMVLAGNGTTGPEGREIVALELSNIQSAIFDLVRQNDVFGQPVFAETAALEIPIGDNIAVAASPARDQFQDLEETLQNMVSAVRSGDPAQHLSAQNALQYQIDNNASLLGYQGITQERFASAKTLLKDRQIELATFRSALEDADLTQAIADMQKLLVNLEAAQATFARIEQSSLFDLIR